MSDWLCQWWAMCLPQQHATVVTAMQGSDVKQVIYDIFFPEYRVLKLHSWLVQR